MTDGDMIRIAGTAAAMMASFVAGVYKAGQKVQRLHDRVDQTEREINAINEALQDIQRHGAKREDLRTIEERVDEIYKLLISANFRKD